MLLLLCLQPVLAFAAPRVVTSIAPLFEITSALMAGVAQPGLLISDNADTHHFAFRPSHMRLLQQADLVIWIDRRFESGFLQLPDFLATHSRQLELLRALDMQNADGHIWYSPSLAIEITKHIGAALEQLDPANTLSYRSNAQELIKRLAHWRNATRNRMSQIQPKFITEHNFLEHFEQDIGIHSLASVQDQHGQLGSLKDLQRLETLLQSNPGICLLTLDARPSQLALELARKYQLTLVNINLTIDTNPAATGILERLDALSRSLSRCGP